MQHSKQKKTTRFFYQVNATLIPSREEFLAAIKKGTIPNLWWEQADYESFKQAEMARRASPSSIEEENIEKPTNNAISRP